MATRPLPLLVSNSEVTSWKRCRRQWWLRYHRQLLPRREDVGTPRDVGTVCHSLLEAHYRGQPWRALLDDIAQSDLQAWPEEAPKIEARDDLVRAILEGYEDWLAETGADAGLTLVATEEALSAPLRPEATLVGKLDQQWVRDHDGARLLRDFKVVESFGTRTRGLRQDRQMLTYLLLQHLNRGPDERCDGALYTMLRRVKRTAQAKPPFYLQAEVRHNVEELRSFWRELQGVVGDLLAARARLEAGEDHRVVCYPTPIADRCYWECDFYQVCSMFDDGSDVDAALGDLYEEGDVLARYAKIEGGELAAGQGQS